MKQTTVGDLIAALSKYPVDTPIVGGTFIVDAPIKRVEHLVARRGGKCRGLKVGSTSTRANANKKLVAFKVPVPNGTLQFAREDRRVTSITIG